MLKCFFCDDVFEGNSESPTSYQLYNLTMFLGGSLAVLLYFQVRLNMYIMGPGLRLWVMDQRHELRRELKLTTVIAKASWH